VIGIIKQIQASITSEAKWLRWVWRKCKRKANYTSIQDKSTNSPSNQAIWMANTNFPPQISKSRRIKGFGENVGQLSLGVYISHLNVSLLYMVSQEVVSPLNMSHLFVEDWIFGYWDSTGVIVHEGNSLKPHSKISDDVYYPKNLWVVATYSASVVDCATEDCFREDQQTRKDLRKWQVCCRPRPTDRRWQATWEPGGPKPLSIGPTARTCP
jgi:hypothetical protein